MKKILSSFILILCMVTAMHSQPCTTVRTPGKPQMGAMIQPQFSNLWKQASVQDEHGQYFKKGVASIGNDGWTVDGVNHTFKFDWNDIQSKLKNGEVIKVKFKGNINQVGTAGEACQINNIIALAGGFVSFEVLITNDKNTNGFSFQLKNRCTDIEFMRPGYNFGDPRLLTDEYVQHVAHWGTFRYANLLSANANFGQTWAKRVSPNAPVYINQYQWSAPDCRNPDPKFPKFSENQLPYGSSPQWGQWSPGAPWETIIDLSNYANKDLWINIPVMADDNYVLQLSKLIKQRLKPTLNVHVEIGYELWNTAPPLMGFYMLRQVLAEEWQEKNPEKLKIIGGSYCPGCGLDGSDEGLSTDPCNYQNWTAMQRWMARRLKEMMEQFAVDWGWKAQGGVGSRIRATLAGQLGYADQGHGWNIRAGIEFLARAYGSDAPAKYLYSTSVVAYFKPGEPEGRFTPNLSLDQIAQNYATYPMKFHFGEYSLEKHNNISRGNKLEGVFGVSKMYGLRMFAYEGGNEIGSGGENGWQTYDNAAAALKDTRVGNANTALLNTWFSWFGDDALFMKNGDIVGGNNAYATSETLNENNAMRKSYIQVANSSAPLFTQARGGTIGIPTIAILDARKYAGYNSNWNQSTTIAYETVTNADYTVKSISNWNKPFLVRNEKSGIYKFSLERSIQKNLTFDKANPTLCDIYLNEKLVFKALDMAVSIDPITGQAWTQPITLEIPYGIHAIRVQPVLPSLAKPGNFTAFINQINISQYRFTLEKECDQPLSTENSKAIDEITLYPNPTNSAVSLLLPSAETTISAYLLDMQGKRLKDYPQLNSATALDLTEFPDGCYQLVLATQKGNVVKRIVKIK